MYETLLYLHILGGLIWVGAGIGLITLVRRVGAKESHEAADHIVDQMKYINNTLFLPAVLVLLATGITMVIVSEAWDFGQAWVIIALALFVFAFIDGAIIGGRMESQLDAYRTAGEQSTAEARQVFTRYMRWGNVSVLIWLVMLAMMVYKPGV